MPLRRALIVLVALAATPLLAMEPGWSELEIPATGSYALLYLPADLPPDQPLPAVVFLHGSGASPEAYRRFVDFAADSAGCVLVLPRSASSQGWGTGQDGLTVSEAARLAAEEVAMDPLRVAIAGHSSGGAYAYLQAYTTVSRYSAVFTLSAPFVRVGAIADPNYTAPIRMYYGTDDPNYSGGSYAALMAQWARLGVEVTTDIRPGYGHSIWPDDAMEEGFVDLVGHSYPELPTCQPSDTRMCLQDGRFALEINWRVPGMDAGPGRVVEIGSEDSGIFWFFEEPNWEMLVKVLDGCDVNGHYWVFAAATTNVEYWLTVTDVHSGAQREYHNLFGVSSPAITDATAFATCP